MVGRDYAYHAPGAGDRGDEVRVNNPKADSNGEGCCSIPCLKFALHLFNILFLLSGAVLVWVGVHAVVEKHPSLFLLSSGLYDLPGYIFAGAGAVIVATSILGCVAICRSSYKQVFWYAILLAVVFAIEVGAGALAYFYKGRVTAEIGANLSQMVLREYGTSNDTTAAIDSLQISLECCGVNSFEDWRDSDWWASAERHNNKVPDSCCLSPSKFCGVRDHPSNVRYTGCIHRINRIAGDSLFVFGAVAVGICVVQLVGFVTACFLHSKLKSLVYYG